MKTCNEKKYIGVDNKKCNTLTGKWDPIVPVPCSGVPKMGYKCDEITGKYRFDNKEFKRIKPEGAPTRPATSFALFMKDETLRQKFQELPKESRGKFASFAAKAWKEISEEQKKAFSDNSASASEKYSEELKRFKTENPDAKCTVVGCNEKARNELLMHQMMHPVEKKMPANSFALFMKSEATRYAFNQAPPNSRGTYPAFASQLWKALSPEEKEEFESQSKSARDDYKKEKEEFMKSQMQMPMQIPMHMPTKMPVQMSMQMPMRMPTKMPVQMQMQMQTQTSSETSKSSSITKKGEPSMAGKHMTYYKARTAQGASQEQARQEWANAKTTKDKIALLANVGITIQQVNQTGGRGRRRF